MATRVGYSDVGWKLDIFGMRKGEELKTPRHASAAALRDDRLPHSQQKDFVISYSGIKRLFALRLALRLR